MLFFVLLFLYGVIRTGIVEGAKDIEVKSTVGLALSLDGEEGIDRLTALVNILQQLVVEVLSGSHVVIFDCSAGESEVIISWHCS